MTVLAVLPIPAVWILTIRAVLAVPTVRLRTILTVLAVLVIPPVPATLAAEVVPSAIPFFLFKEHDQGDDQDPDLDQTSYHSGDPGGTHSLPAGRFQIFKAVVIRLFTVVIRLFTAVIRPRTVVRVHPAAIRCRFDPIWFCRCRLAEVKGTLFTESKRISLAKAKRILFAKAER